MRIAFAIILLAAAAPFDTAKSDPYRWCADYGGGGMGPGRNCYFITLEQCRGPSPATAAAACSIHSMTAVRWSCPRTVCA